MPKFENITIYKTSLLSGGMALPPFCIFITNNATEDLLQHEYGHILQYKKYGFWYFYFVIGIPSILNALANKIELKLFGKIKYSINHKYLSVELEANRFASAYFGKSAAISKWPQNRV